MGAARFGCRVWGHDMGAGYGGRVWVQGMGA